LTLTKHSKDKGSYKQAKQKLKDLVLGKTVDIKSTKIIDEWGRLVTDVYYAGKGLADYFSEYKI